VQLRWNENHRICTLSKANHVLLGSQTRRGTLQEACEHLGRNLRHIFQDLGLRAVEKDDIDDFAWEVGCRCCALLLEKDGILCGTLEARGHRARNEFNERTLYSIKFRTACTSQRTLGTPVNHCTIA